MQTAVRYCDRPAMLDARFARGLDVEGCDCNRDKIGRRPIANLASYRIQYVRGLPGKAQIWPGTGFIQIDSDFWATTTSEQKAAILNHELAHDEDPAACESCADARAGARMRWQGYTAEVAVEALAGVVRSRQAGGAVLNGWQIADEVIRDRSTTTSGIAEADDLVVIPADSARGYQLPARAADGSVDNQVAGIMSPDRLRFSLPRGFDGFESPELELSIGDPDVDDGQSIGAPSPPRTQPARPPRTSTPTPPIVPPTTPKKSGAGLAIFAGVAILVAVVVFKKG